MPRRQRPALACACERARVRLCMRLCVRHAMFRSARGAVGCTCFSCIDFAAMSLPVSKFSTYGTGQTGAGTSAQRPWHPASATQRNHVGLC
jgi:hypothetical protein